MRGGGGDMKIGNCMQGKEMNDVEVMEEIDGTCLSTGINLLSDF